MTAEYDEGPVVAQTEVPVRADDDVPALRSRVQAAEKELLVEVIRRWFDQQDEARSTAESLDSYEAMS